MRGRSAIGRRDSGLGFYGSIDEVRLVPSAFEDREVQGWFWGERIRGVALTPAEKRSVADSETLLDYYIDHFADTATTAAITMAAALRFGWPAAEFAGGSSTAKPTTSATTSSRMVSTSTT